MPLPPPRVSVPFARPPALPLAVPLAVPLTLAPALALACLLCAALPAAAAVRLPAILSDHMVLQRSAATPVWGWADAGESVTVRIGALEAATRAGADGRWRIDLDLSAAHAAT